ncbi:UNVERIFIED_CONTAM: hypothetical protein H355_008716 [Colinus virginianus]|nr:hypothetical protein H355_008716 [Colinus virginianus]
MVEGSSRSTRRFCESIRTMRTHLYLLLLTVAASASVPQSDLAELQTLLKQIHLSVDTLVNLIFPFLYDSLISWNIESFSEYLAFTKSQTIIKLRIETPVSADDENCTKTLFEGTELLKNNPKMKRFEAFFQRFDRLRLSLTANLEREGECDTERKDAKKFIEKLITFIRKLSSRNARV